MSRSAELRIADLSRVIAPLTRDICRICSRAPTTCSRDDYLFRQAESTMQIEHTHAICQPGADPTLLGYRAPHRRAAASPRLGQVGGRAAGRGHSEGFPWNGGILTAEHLEDAQLLFGLDRGGSKS